MSILQIHFAMQAVVCFLWCIFIFITGEKPCVYYVGIIDILTNYGAMKKAAHAAKTVKHGVRCYSWLLCHAFFKPYSGSLMCTIDMCVMLLIFFRLVLTFPLWNLGSMQEGFWTS